jgi:hypothetical protein
VSRNFRLAIHFSKSDPSSPRRGAGMRQTTTAVVSRARTKPVMAGIGAEPGQKEHRSPSTKLPRRLDTLPTCCYLFSMNYFRD